MISGKLNQLVNHDPGVWRQRPQIIAVHRVLLVAVVLVGTFQSAPAQQEQQALEEVREQIENIEEHIESELSRMDEDRQALRRVETRIADQHGVLQRIRRERAAEQAQLEELNAAADAARTEMSAEREALARQVLLSYMTGREELLKLVLNQQSPSALGRMVVWYDYFNDYRSNRIDSVRDDLERLATLLRETRAAEQRLAELSGSAQAELAELESQRAQRNSIIGERENKLAESGRTLETLREDEDRLADLVLELGDLLAAFPAEASQPFAELRGQLPWPAAGEVVSGYGEQRNGPLRWNGMLLDAEQGSPVRSVYHGQVRVAEWLPGLGLLMIVDHGDGYLSLYGHNEVLLREPGEWVTPGDELAQVGSAGGRTGLYFEIRHQGEPINPRDWLRGEPGTATR